MTQHSLPNYELCHDTSDSESVPNNGQTCATSGACACSLCLLHHRFNELSICNAVPYRACISDQEPEYQIDYTCKRLLRLGPARGLGPGGRVSAPPARYGAKWLLRLMLRRGRVGKHGRAVVWRQYTHVNVVVLVVVAVWRHTHGCHCKANRHTALAP